MPSGLDGGGDADKNIKIRYIVEAQDAIDAAKKFRQHVEEMKVALKTMSKEGKVSINDLTKDLKSLATSTVGDGSQLKNFGKIVSTSVREIKQEQKGLSQETDKTTNSFSNLISAGLRLFGVFSAVQVLRQFVDYLRQATEAALEFAKAVFTLGVGINALQRSGVEITVKDVYDNLDALQKKFGIFSKKELVEGSAALINLVRDFGFAKEEIFGLQEAIATLAIVNGRAMDDVQRTVALAVSSGYTEGLQRLGVSINRVTIALEAERLGYGRNYMSLTEMRRAEATYNLILQKTAKYSNDLLQYQKTLPGAIDKETAAITDLRIELGNNFMPIMLTLLQLQSNFLQGINGIVTGLKLVGATASTIQIQLGRLFRGEGILNPDELFAEQVKAAFPSLYPTTNTEDESRFVTRQRREEDFIEKRNEKIAELADELGNELIEIQEEYEKELLDANEDFKQEILDIDIRYNQKIEDVERQFAQKIIDIGTEYDRKYADAYTNYKQKLVDIDIWYAQSVQDAARKYHEQQIDEEKDYQRKLLELREEFIFDMQTAIENRDARAALNLIRRYNLDKKQLERRHDDEQEDNEEAYQRELAELKRQLAEKRKQANIDYQRALADLNLSKQRELEALNIWKQREYEDAELWRARERDSAAADFNRRYNTANKEWNKQIKLVAEKMYAQLKTQHGYLDLMYKDLLNYIGPQGVMQLLWKYYHDAALAAISGTAGGAIGTPTASTPSAGGFAEGGTVFANKPTMALFGERGAEYATFTPANKMGGGKMSIELLLSPDLQARVVDDALGQFADVMVEVHKERR